MLKTTSLVALIFTGAVATVGCSHKTTTNITPVTPATEPEPATTTTSSTTTTTEPVPPPPPEQKTTTTTTTTAPTP